MRLSARQPDPVRARHSSGNSAHLRLRVMGLVAASSQAGAVLAATIAITVHEPGGHPLAGPTDATGSWSAEVPRGRYRVSIWNPRLRDEAVDFERELTIGDTDRATLTLRLAKSLQPARIEGRPHSWDSY